jgi:Zn finger protein HypA/HybF involved in hydrogenase expression
MTITEQHKTRCVCDECYADFEAALPPDGSDEWDAIKCPKCGSGDFGWSDETGDE